MSREVNTVRTAQILQFIQHFNREKGYGPTVREIGNAVGLKSASTVTGYLDRLRRDGLIASEPGTSRSLHVIEPQSTQRSSGDGTSKICCRLKIPDGKYPMGVIVVLSDGNRITSVQAEEIQVMF